MIIIGMIKTPLTDIRQRKGVEYYIHYKHKIHLYQTYKIEYKIPDKEKYD